MFSRKFLGHYFVNSISWKINFPSFGNCVILLNENYTHLFEALIPLSRTKSFSISQSQVKIKICTVPNEILKMNLNEYFIKLTTSNKKSASQTERLSSNQHFYNRNVVFRAWTAITGCRGRKSVLKQNWNRQNLMGFKLNFLKPLLYSHFDV